MNRSADGSGSKNEQKKEYDLNHEKSKLCQCDQHKGNAVEMYGGNENQLKKDETMVRCFYATRTPESRLLGGRSRFLETPINLN